MYKLKGPAMQVEKRNWKKEKKQFSICLVYNIPDQYVSMI